MAWNENVVYDNFVLENKFKDILKTKLDAVKFMTVDSDLQGVEGMKKTINTYTYEGVQLKRLQKVQQILKEGR